VIGIGRNSRSAWPESALIRESGKNGVLFLHLLDGEFAVFLQEPRDPGQETSGK
jgi:hypothetical protein